MRIRSRLKESRRRKRTVSTLDAPWRRAVRAVEARGKGFLMAIFRAWLRPVERDLPMAIDSVRSVLILRYDALGDAILATPVWRAIKRANPNIHIGVAGSVSNIAFLREDDSIDSTYVFSRSLSLDIFRELRKARSQKWDVVLNLYFHDKTRGAILARLAAPNAVTATAVRTHRERYEGIYSYVGERPRGVAPILEQNLTLARSVLKLPFPAGTLRPILPASFANQSPARDGSYIVLHTEASQDYKEWGTENYLALTRLLLRNTHSHILWTSSQARKDRCAAALMELDSTRAEYFETPSLPDLAGVVGGASAVVSPDTSIVHIATALQIPIVGLYLEENDFLPYGGPSRVLFSIDGRRVSSIPPAHVFEALNQLLQTGKV